MILPLPPLNLPQPYQTRSPGKKKKTRLSFSFFFPISFLSLSFVCPFFLRDDCETKKRGKKRRHRPIGFYSTFFSLSLSLSLSFFCSPHSRAAHCRRRSLSTLPFYINHKKSARRRGTRKDRASVSVRRDALFACGYWDFFPTFFSDPFFGPLRFYKRKQAEEGGKKRDTERVVWSAWSPAQRPRQYLLSCCPFCFCFLASHGPSFFVENHFVSLLSFIFFVFGGAFSVHVQSQERRRHRGTLGKRKKRKKERKHKPRRRREESIEAPDSETAKSPKKTDGPKRAEQRKTPSRPKKRWRKKAQEEAEKKRKRKRKSRTQTTTQTARVGTGGMEGRRIWRRCRSSARHQSHSGWRTLARACLCVYSGVALVAALAEAFLWRTRSGLGLVAACRGTGPWPCEPAPPAPGTGDAPWSAWPACLLVGFGAGTMWPVWAAAVVVLLRRRR